MIKPLVDHIQSQLAVMTKDAQFLYQVDVDPDQLWNFYLESYPAEYNPVYRKRREYDCSCCKHFIRRFGHVVAIKDGQMISIWDNGDALPEPFNIVSVAMAGYINSLRVRDVYYTNTARIGTAFNYEEGTGKRWDHLHAEIPARFVAPRGISEGDYQGRYRDPRNVFKRSLDEIKPEAVDTLLELIAQNTLYRGEEWKSALNEFKRLQIAYLALPHDIEQHLFAWEHGVVLNPAVSKIRNHSIGTLLIDLSNGEELDSALRKYESVVAPANYKRPKAVFTQRMVKDAEKKITELGYLDSLSRRHARLSDISVNNILFVNRDAQKHMIGGENVFASLKPDAKTAPKDFSRVEEISAEDFVSNVLPAAKEVEVYLENKHAPNMVSLIAPANMEAPSMFKWNNAFGWAYAGNIADSSIRENVKKAGGKVDGDLRFSIQWNDSASHDPNDIDAHCHTPRGEIYFGYRRVGTGELDIDITHPSNGQVAVENITWPDRRGMTPGKYQFSIHCWAGRGGKSGFRAEIAFDGQIYYFDHKEPLHSGDTHRVATVTLDHAGHFSIESHMEPAEAPSRELWSLKTGTFVPVSTIMYSPNYWDEQTGNGNRHYFFMLKDCINPDQPNGFYNEFLKNELLEHKRVFEALGSRLRVEADPDQLSGVGFSSTKRGELVVRVTGATRRLLKIKF